MDWPTSPGRVLVQSVLHTCKAVTPVTWHQQWQIPSSAAVAFFGDFAVVVYNFQPCLLVMRHWLNWLHMEVKDVCYKTVSECTWSTPTSTTVHRSTNCDFGIIYKSSDLLTRSGKVHCQCTEIAYTTVAMGSDFKFPCISGQNEQDTLSNIVNMFMQLHAATV